MPAHEITTDMGTVCACVPEYILLESNTSTAHDIPCEKQTTVSRCTHEFTLEVETVNASVPQVSFDIFERVSAIKEIPIKEESVNGCAHESTSEVETVSALQPEASYEMESVTAVKTAIIACEVLAGSELVYPSTLCLYSKSSIPSILKLSTK